MGLLGVVNPESLRHGGSIPPMGQPRLLWVILKPRESCLILQAHAYWTHKLPIHRSLLAPRASLVGLFTVLEKSLFTLLFETPPLSVPGACGLTRLAGQQTPAGLTVISPALDYRASRLHSALNMYARSRTTQVLMPTWQAFYQLSHLHSLCTHIDTETRKPFGFQVMNNVSGSPQGLPRVGP